jgi:hypothetical protein
MASVSQKKASAAHRRKSAARGFFRIEVQAAKGDAALIRELARTFREEPERAGIVRSTLQQALGITQPTTAFDIFGSDLPEKVFEDVFEQPRAKSWHEVEI